MNHSLHIFSLARVAKVVLLPLSVAVLVFVFIKNAWVTEDAYILFRSIDQLYAGNGPVWNMGERVQVFTSPLWCLVVAVAGLLSKDLYLVTIILSLLLTVALWFVLVKIFRDRLLVLISIVLLVGSSAFFDFTSSGLENPLAYFLLSVYFLIYLRLTSPDDAALSAIDVRRNVRALMLVFGLIIVVRHDLLLIVLPATIYILFSRFRVYSIRRWIVLGLLALMPLLVYTLFSLIYYGFPFPNTAYAKLYTGIDRWDLVRQGLTYLYVSLKYDVLTMLIIFSFLGWVTSGRAPRAYTVVGAGVVLNLIYVVYVGGDFMRGRFISYAYLISVVFLVLGLSKIRSRAVLFGVLISASSYAMGYPISPLRTGLDYHVYNLDHGVADERGYYFWKLSLYQYYRLRERGESFPAHPWARMGREFRGSGKKIVVKGNIGLFGYYSGLDQFIVDDLALADPLLARMRVSDKKWRVGHYRRAIPSGYLDTLASGRNQIEDKRIWEYYQHLRLVVRGEDLFSLERLRTILRFNLGEYDHLVRGGGAQSQGG